MGTGRDLGVRKKVQCNCLTLLPSSPAKPDLQQALVPEEKELVPVRRPVWSQFCLYPLYPQQLR